MALNPLANGFVVQVEPERIHVRPGDTATFGCEVITEEPIREFSWEISPPMSATRYTYDNNHKTIHISNISISENNTRVTCIVDSESGVEMRESALIGLLEEQNEDDDEGGGDGGDDGGDDGGRVPGGRPPGGRTTPRLRITSVPSNGVSPRQRITTKRPNSPKSLPTSTLSTGQTYARITRAGGMTLDDPTPSASLNPATLGASIAIGGLILMAIIVVIVQRLRKNRHQSSKSKTNFRSRMHFNNASYHGGGGYEVAPVPPMAPTIDSRHSQSPDVIPTGHTSRYCSPKYQKPIHKNHKSLPSMAQTSCVDEYEYMYMEPGEQQGRSLAVPFGNAYDHLARSTPEALHKLVVPNSPPTPGMPSAPANYAKLTASENNARTSYENQNVVRNHTFELSEERKLKYASLSHQDRGSDSPVHTPRRKISYAKIRGVLKILRTRNSTRVNIEPC